MEVIIQQKSSYSCPNKAFDTKIWFSSTLNSFLTIRNALVKLFN